jgi:proline iminopeptidase
VSGSLIPAGDTELYVVERGSGHPLFLLHGEPGDHHMFAHYLDPLAERFRLLLVDLRGHGLSAAAPLETCTLEQMARDVGALAGSLGLERYAVLGHSMGSFVALQHAVDSPGAAAQTIVSSCVPAPRFLDGAIDVLNAFEPEELREQVLSSIERESTAQTPGEVTALMRDQLPVHFADPRDPRIADYAERTAGSVYRPETLRHLAATGYGSIDVEHRLATIPQPLLVLAGGADRICPPAAAEAIAAGAPKAELVILQNSGHFTFVEENERYVAAVADFLDRHTEEHP